MDHLLDLATIKFDFKWKRGLLAKVTLNWQDEFEVRFCRLSLRGDGTIWFQPPALKDFGYAKCFVVLDKDQWAAFSAKVIEQFRKETKEEEQKGMIPPNILEQLNGEQIVEPDDIPL